MAHASLHRAEKVRMTTTLTYPEAPPERGRGARVDGGSRLLHLSHYAHYHFDWSATVGHNEACQFFTDFGMSETCLNS